MPAPPRPSQPAPAPPRAEVAALVPALDAGDSVAAVVAAARAQVTRVLVVDDGSRDHTAAAAEEAGAEVLRLARNRGKGAALQSGMERLLDEGCARVVTLDADGQHRADEIPRLLAAACGDDGEAPADLVLGVRAQDFAAMSRLRRHANRLSSRAISFAAGQPIADVQTGFRCYARALLERWAMPGTGFEAESAIVVLACRHGFRVVTTPVAIERADGRAGSHYRPLRDSLRIAGAVTRARLRPAGYARAAR